MANLKSDTKLVIVHDSRADISNNLHVALRKYVHSTAASIAWNLFHCLPDETISWFYGLIEPAIKNVAFPNVEALAEVVSRAVLDDSTYVGKPDRAALHATFMLFDEGDWYGYVSLLYEEMPVISESIIAIDRGPLGAILEGIEQAYKETPPEPEQ